MAAVRSQESLRALCFRVELERSPRRGLFIQISADRSTAADYNCQQPEPAITCRSRMAAIGKSTKPVAAQRGRGRASLTGMRDLPQGARVITVAHKVWQGLSKGCAKEPSEATTQLLRLARRRDTVIASTKPESKTK